MNNQKDRNLGLYIGLIMFLTTFNLAFVAKAGDFREIKSFFTRPPLLVNSSATKIAVWSLGSKYYFTITIPENAGASLQKVIVTQRRGVEDIRYQVDRTFAFMGTPKEKGESLNLQASSDQDDTAPITINFTAPVSPGTTFTIGLVPKINPGFGDTYLFGITVFPAGANSRGLYLGVGRISFFQQSPFQTNPH